MLKKANLCWRLFKCQIHFQGIEYIKYKRPSGTHWLEHQLAALKSHIHNLPVFIRFCNNQVTNSDNNQIKNIKSKLEGFKDDICETKHLVFEAVKFDVWQSLSPVSKNLQEVSLLTPKVMSLCRKMMRSFDKLLILLYCDGRDACQRDDVFRTASEILEKLTDEEEEIIPDRRT